MKISLYVGDHAKDDWLARFGWAITRYTQKGPYGDVTHVEAIHAEHADGTVTMASASLRDGGVRAKTVRLNPAHWMIADVPQWDVQDSIDFLAQTNGAPYDWRGAWATRLPGSGDDSAWFCNEWVSAPFLQASDTFGPHHLASICLSLGRDVTQAFFLNRVYQKNQQPETKP